VPSGMEHTLTTKYKHALCLHPYFRDSHSGSLGLAVFPPVGLEYIAASLSPYVEKLTFLDLRLPDPLRKPEKLKRFIEEEIDLLCISINWETTFVKSRTRELLPSSITTVVGGKQATDCVDEISRLPECRCHIRGRGRKRCRDRSGKGLQGHRRNILSGWGQCKHNNNRPFLRWTTTVTRIAPATPGLSHERRRTCFVEEQFDIILTARGCPYNCKF
jgi:hypothetical protein